MSTSLRPQCVMHAPTAARPSKVLDAMLWREFVFSREPIICPNASAPPSDIDSGDETDEDDHEGRICSSWHHRALLGDRNRMIYTDLKDSAVDACEEAPHPVPDQVQTK